MGTSASPRFSFSSLARRVSCPGLSILRRKRMKPAGFTSRKKALSQEVSSVPATPKMTAAGAVLLSSRGFTVREPGNPAAVPAAAHTGCLLPPATTGGQLADDRKCLFHPDPPVRCGVAGAPAVLDGVPEGASIRLESHHDHRRRQAES